MEARTTLILTLSLVTACRAAPGDDDDDSAPAPTPERCVVPGDEDGDGLDGCEDPDCANRFDCAGRMLSYGEAIYRQYVVAGRPGDPELGSGDPYPRWGQGLGDFDGDGVPDFGIGNRWFNPGEGGDIRIVLAASSQNPDPDTLHATTGPYAEHPTDAVGDISGAAVSTECDLNGDGFDDLVAVDDWEGMFFGIGPDPSYAVTIAFGTPTPPPPDAELPVITLPLTDPAGVVETMVCLGDIDGDGREDMILDITYDGASLKALLDPDALIDGVPLLLASRRLWDRPLGKTRALGDVNGDGLDDVFLAFYYGHYSQELGGAVVGRVLPGSPALAGRIEGISWPENEVDPGGHLLLEMDTDVPLSGDGIYFHDLDGDGVVDLVSPVFNEVFGSYSILSGAPLTHLGEEDEGLIRIPRHPLGGRMHTLTEEDDVGPWHHRGADPAASGDLNGDGLPDLVLQAFGIDFVPGTQPAWLPDGQAWAAGLAIFFGDGRLDGFDRPFIEADVFLPNSFQWSPAPLVQIVDDVDGDGIDDLAFWVNGANREPFDPNAPWGAGILSGARLSAAAAPR